MSPKWKILIVRLLPPMLFDMLRGRPISPAADTASGSRWKILAARLLPPVLYDALRRRRATTYVEVETPQGTTVTKPEWEMVPDNDAAWVVPEGWSHGSITERQLEKWNAFMASLARPLPLGRSHEAAPDAPVDVSPHNTVMSFAYAVGRALSDARGGAVSLLDWGGGLGHYYQYAKALYPDAPLDYSIKDLPELCEAGRKWNEGAHFIEDETAALSRRYDLVFASSALHYTRDVYDLIGRLCDASSRYLMVTRTPFLDTHDDFVVVQRPHAYGYFTEYAGWFLNKDKFIRFVEGRGFELDREFLLAERPYVPNASEQCFYRGFLFRRVQ